MLTGPQNQNQIVKLRQIAQRTRIVLVSKMLAAVKDRVK